MKKSWDFWELKAIEYLKSKWYKIIDTNFKYSRFWEIDIICKIEEIYVFVEVKYRINSIYWTWEEYINFSKIKKLDKTIHFYCLKNKINLENIRFDIFIIEKHINFFRYKHYKNQEL